MRIFLIFTLSVFAGCASVGSSETEYQEDEVTTYADFEEFEDESEEGVTEENDESDEEFNSYLDTLGGEGKGTVFTEKEDKKQGYFKKTSRDCHVRDKAEATSLSLNVVNKGRRLWVEPTDNDRWNMVYMESRTAYMHKACFKE
jgi:uncharacterized protein YceK